MSDNESRLRRAFAVGLHLQEIDSLDTLAYAASPSWDSLAHMTLIAVLEEEFGVSFEADDVLELSSYAKARDLLATRGVTF